MVRGGGFVVGNSSALDTVMMDVIIVHITAGNKGNVNRELGNRK
jgi:hypothetical protein